MPVTTVAAAALVFDRLKMVFCEIVWFTVVVMLIPMTEAAVVVPVPPGAVRLRIVLPLIVPMGKSFLMPCTVVPVAALVLCNELATVPPTVLFWQVKVTVDPVLTRMPKMLAAAGVALVLPAVMPPMLLLFTVQLLDPKLKMAITSDELLDVVV